MPPEPIPPSPRPGADATDHALMAGLAAGDGAAARVLFDRWRPRLVNYFRGLGADLHGAEDCAQETLIRVHGYRAAYRPDTHYEAFLFTLARHAFYDWRRRAARRPVEALPDDPAAPAPSGGRDVARDPGRLDLAEAVAALPPRLRGVVELGAIRGLPYEQVAALLGIPVGTVKSRMFLAVRRLRERLGDADEAP